MRQESNPQTPRRETDLQSAALAVRPRMRKILSKRASLIIRMKAGAGGRLHNALAFELFRRTAAPAARAARAAFISHEVLRLSNNKRSGPLTPPYRKQARSFKSPRTTTRFFGSGQHPLPRVSKIQVMLRKIGPTEVRASGDARRETPARTGPAYGAQAPAGRPLRAANLAAAEARRAFRVGPCCCRLIHHRLSPNLSAFRIT